MKFKIILTVLFISINSFSFANNKEENILPINGKYVEKFETKNIVFNEIYKKFIKDYENNFKITIKEIEENNQKIENSNKSFYINIEKDLKNFKYEDDSDLSIYQEKNNFLNKYAYDINRLSKLKLDFQEKKINEFLKNQIDNYKLILKETINEYDLTSEEEDFISEKSKEILSTLINKLKENEKYSKTKLDSLKIDLSTYKEIQNKYSEELKNMNYRIDAEIFNLIWKDVRSNSKYPKIDE